MIDSKWVVEQGTRWQVGNGESIRIWHDRWIPRQGESRVITPRNTLDEGDMVSKLLNINENGWNTPLIDSVFLVGEAALIKTIPTSRIRGDDVLIWIHTRSGGYTVKSAYHIILEGMERNKTSSASKPNYKVEFEWKRFWKMKMSGKIKFFGWQAIRDILPTSDKLMKKGMDVDPICKVCGTIEETGVHCLKECEVAREIWFASPMGIRTDSSSAPNVKEWFAEMMRNCTNEEFVWFLSLAWLVWKNRNRVVFQGKGRRTMEICNSFAECVEERMHPSILDGAQQMIQWGSKKWRPPRKDVIKINTDGASCSMSHTCGVGMVARGDDGLVLAAKAKAIQWREDSDALELSAILEGMVWAREMGWSEIELENDSMGMIATINSGQITHVTGGAMLRDIAGISVLFKYCLFFYARREKNYVAHTLAKHALCIEAEEWVTSLPRFIAPYCKDDLRVD